MEQFLNFITIFQEKQRYWLANPIFPEYNNVCTSGIPKRELSTTVLVIYFSGYKKEVVHFQYKRARVNKIA